MALKPKLMADGAAGKVAVFMVDENNPADRAPLDDPHSHLARVLFHSDLLYPIITHKVSGTLTLPARGSNQDWTRSTHILFAHGLAGQPLVFGRLTNVGPGTVPLAGSVPIQTSSYGFARWLSLGADATNVMITELWNTHVTGGIGAISVNWDVWVTNIFLDQENPLPPPQGELLYIDGTNFRAGRGKFSTANRYIRTAATNKEFPVVKGRSLVAQDAPNNLLRSAFRYSVDGYVQQQTQLYQGAQQPQAVAPMAFDAMVQPARTE